MKYNRVVSTAVMFLLLGTTVPAFAQKGGEEKGGGKAQRAQQQPQRTQQARQPARQATQTVVANRGGGGGGQYGRISNANYSAHFGHEHSFHMGRPQLIGGYNRFQYGGYWFGYNQVWPAGWGYDDDVYVEYIDGAYYMLDLRHPGI